MSDQTESEKKKEDWIPYTYLLIHDETGLCYYGVRYQKNCNPSEFWKTYKTSSRHVKKLVEEYGEQSFSFQIRKTFTNPTAARMWEHKVLRRMQVIRRKDFLNKTDNISIAPMHGGKNPASRQEVKEKISNSLKEWHKINPNPNLGRVTSSEIKNKQSLKKLGNKNPFFGKKHSEESKLLFSNRQQGEKNSFFGCKHSEETKKRMSVSQRGRKKPKIQCPHCHQAGAPNVIYRWHYNHCKLKKDTYADK